MNPEDPFLTVHRDVQTLLTQTRPLLTSYLRIRSTASSATSPELIESRRELHSALTDLSADLQDLIASVQAVERDPYKYGLDVAEVGRRRGLVQDVEREVEDMRRQVEGVVENAPSPTEQRRRSQPNGNSAALSGAVKGKGKETLPAPDAFEDDDMDKDDDAYVEFEEQRQQELLHEQDEALDGVFRTVGNLRMQADEMGRELEEQGELLDGVDTLADRVGGKLQNGLKRVGWVIRNNEDTYSSCCIGVLIFVLILLLILVLIV